MKKVLLGLLGVIFLFIIYIGYRTFQVPETPIHYHANFAVFINNQQVDFSDPSYMHLAPCLADTSVISLNKLDNVHLHDQVGNVVHMHQARITWNDLFASIKYDLYKSAGQNKIAYYLNGKRTTKEVLSKVIEKEDKLLISADAQEGPEAIEQSEYLKKQYQAVGDTAKEYDNGTKGAEHCGAEGKRSLKTRLQIALKTLFSDSQL